MSIEEEYTDAQRKGILRGLLVNIWIAYLIRDFRSNDAQGMANQVKNVMKKKEIRDLPHYARINEYIIALLKTMSESTSNLEPNDLKMLAAMPDLRVQYQGTRLSFNEGTGYENEVSHVYDTEISCKELRERAAEILRP